MKLKQLTLSFFLLSVFTIFISANLIAQDYASKVNPFIGTDASDAKSIWGKYGGTYPGAVAPWGNVQLSPETSKSGERGYFYSDSSICYFTCVNHNSGYPHGSSGRLQVVMTKGTVDTDINSIRLPFSHKKEKASPGYYSVTFDDGSQVETTVSTRTGMFRYKPIDGTFIVTIADAGDIKILDKNTIYTSRSNGVFVFNKAWKKYKLENKVLILEFECLPANTPLLCKVGFSTVDEEGSRKNLQTECPLWDFEGMRNKTHDEWNRELSVLDISTGDADDIENVYTALYHSFLIPCVSSDVDGRYRGKDRKIYRTEGENEYTTFSTWDTFRSLHPLLCLLKPERQRDMLRSMLHIYQQEGQLPYTPMIGYYSLPVITDSYKKEITDFDTSLALEAMSKTLSGNQIPRQDTYKYIAEGYLNDSIEESVSVTLDYAYNDWTLGAFLEALEKKEEAQLFYNRSLSYRNLFDYETGFMLPRNSNGFVKEPGEMGYKESNKWTTTWFVPHNIQDLINLMGGDELFVKRLNDAMEAGHIIHDNEPVVHYPYLFSYAGRPDLTCQWVDHIRKNAYTTTPGGITGNDDLGSMSSWLVFSSLGFFPVCPGSAEYVLNMPLFPQATINLSDEKKLHINAETNTNYKSFSELKLNDKPLSQVFITHEQIKDGGKLNFSAGKPDNYNHWKRPYSLTKECLDAEVSSVKFSADKAVANEELYAYCEVTNKGARGVFQLSITDDNNQVVAQKNILVDKGESVTDSIAFRLYRKGTHTLNIGGQTLNVEVKPSIQKNPITCIDLTSSAIAQLGSTIRLRIELQNISDSKYIGEIPLEMNGKSGHKLSVELEPGEKRGFQDYIIFESTGIYTVSVLNTEHKVKIYNEPLESVVANISFDGIDKNIAIDNSGFDNHATIHGTATLSKLGIFDSALKIDESSYISLPSSASLNITGKTVSMVAWVFPTKADRGYIDFFSKGDNMMLKTSGNSLEFFAGGWGRGTCSTSLPNNWLNNWHHVAGVCDGKMLRIYIDGKLQKTEPIAGEDIYETVVPWNIGRNAEMPYSRRYEGMIGNIQIYKEALTDEDITTLFEKK